MLGLILLLGAPTAVEARNLGDLATHPDVIVDPFGVADARQVEVGELQRIQVALLASEAYDLRTLSFQSLRIGDDFGALGLPKKRRFHDVDHDGRRDWVVEFDLSDSPFDLQANARRIAWVTGVVAQRDQVWFEMRVVFQLGNDTEKCQFQFASSDPADSQAPFAYRCTYYTSYAAESTANLLALNVTNLVAAINSDAQEQAYTTSVKSDSVVVIEAWGANGGHGRANDNANGGAGGAAGYAILDNQVSAFEAAGELNLYVGAPSCTGSTGDGGGGGGGSTAVSSKPFQEINVPSSVVDPTQFGILLIAGGGGGGGNGYEHESTHHTGKGGGGGAIIETGSTVNLTFAQGSSGSREAASSSYGGGGGAVSGSQTGIGGGGGGGESSHGSSGSNGIGGIGGFDGSNCPIAQMWQQTAFAVNQSSFGRGGSGGHQEGSQGGFGGGGFGSGGGGASGYLVEAFKTSNSSPGGGGGGSFSDRSLLLPSNSIVAPLVVGHSGASVPSVTITYEMQP